MVVGTSQPAPATIGLVPARDAARTQAFEAIRAAGVGGRALSLPGLQPLSSSLKAGEARAIRVEKPVALSNKGGAITVLDENGLKVDGVSYAKAQASNPGWTIVF